MGSLDPRAEVPAIGERVFPVFWRRSPDERAVVHLRNPSGSSEFAAKIAPGFDPGGIFDAIFQDMLVTHIRIIMNLSTHLAKKGPAVAARPIHHRPVGCAGGAIGPNSTPGHSEPASHRTGRPRRACGPAVQLSLGCHRGGSGRPLRWRVGGREFRRYGPFVDYSVVRQIARPDHAGSEVALRTRSAIHLSRSSRRVMRRRPALKDSGPSPRRQSAKSVFSGMPVSADSSSTPSTGLADNCAISPGKNATNLNLKQPRLGAYTEKSFARKSKIQIRGAAASIRSLRA